MRNNSVKILSFIFGVAVGSAVTYKLLNDKYAKLAHEEINELREFYRNKMSELEEAEYLDYDDEENEEDSSDDSNDEVNEYENTVKDLGYSEDQPRREIEKHDYEIIEPEEFGDIEGYDTIYLTWYSGDGYLADDHDELVECIEEKVGWDNLKQIGKYEEGIIHIRNYTLEVDYEISLDERNYLDVVGNPEED